MRLKRLGAFSKALSGPALSLGFWAIAVLAGAGCSADARGVLPEPGLYFYRIGAASCETFEIGDDGVLSETEFCDGQARIAPGFFSPPTVACTRGRHFGITATLDGFALTQRGQVLVFVFPTLERCRAGLPPDAPAQTL